MKTIGLASDHAGFELKEYVKTYLTEKGIEFIDYGTDSTASCDYPDFAGPAAEAVAAGTVKLAGVDRNDIITMAHELITDPEAYAAMAHAVNPYGDGQACRRIVDAIEWHFGLREQPPEEFHS